MKLAALFLSIVALAGCQELAAFDSPPETGAQCSDGLDNDGNGLIDCADPSCAGTATCMTPDAPTSDARVIDARVTDASTLDASTLDARPIDAPLAMDGTIASPDAHVVTFDAPATNIDASIVAPTDAAVTVFDATPDATPDAGPDAGPDASPDAAPIDAFIAPPIDAAIIPPIDAGAGSVDAATDAGSQNICTVGAVATIAAGGAHACAIVGGGVQCWGYNGYGQLGVDNSLANSNLPLPVTGLSSGAQAIAAGQYHNCALVNGGVQCWGSNQYGQLGNNSNIDSYTPVAVQGLESGVQAIAVGTSHSCAIQNGAVFCWGLNNTGQLGDDTDGNASFVPQQVVGLPGGAQSIDGGANHTCAVVDGGVWCWGYNNEGELGDGNNSQSDVAVQVLGLSGVQSIGISGYTSCAVANGGAQCWGYNNEGELGNDSRSNSNVPVGVTGLSTGVQAISGGAFLHECAIVNGGALCWGYGGYGQLGAGNNNDFFVPEPVLGLSSGVQEIAAGDQETCAILNGGIQCWGADDNGQLGNGSNSSISLPQAVVGLTGGIQAIAGGGYHTCAIINGGIQCWGSGGNGALGNGTLTDSVTPVAVAGITSGAQSLGLGLFHSCAVVNGAAMCWGYNGLGEVGDGSAGNVITEPEQVVGLSSGVQAITAGYFHTCALVNGGVKCWGNDANGELGDGQSINDGPTPVDVIGLTSGVQAISAGGYTTCALVDGGVWCWGYSGEGELGDGSFATSLVPVQVPGFTSGVEAISGADDHMCATMNGAVSCWGSDDNNQLADEAFTNNPSPVIALTSDVQMLAAGGSCTCVVIDGSAQCWGENESGQNGNGEFTTNSPILPVFGITGGIQAISSGDQNDTCVLIDGAVWCWGYNGYGELGDGTHNNSNVPVRVLFANSPP